MRFGRRRGRRLKNKLINMTFTRSNMKRKVPVTFRISALDYQDLLHRARKEGISISEFVRKNVEKLLGQ